MTARTHISAALACATLVLAGGCVQIESSLSIEPNGSGRLHYVYGMSDQMLAQLDGMRSLARQLDDAQGKPSGVATNQDLATPSPFEESAVRKALKAYESYGIALESLKFTRRNDWKFVDVVVSFKNVAALSRAPFLGDTVFELTQPAEGACRLTQKYLNGAEPLDITDPEIQKNVMPILAGLKVTVAVTTPGRILESNAQKRAEQTVMWEVDIDRNPEVIRNYQRDGLYVAFEAKGLKIDAGAKDGGAAPGKIPVPSGK